MDTFKQLMGFVLLGTVILLLQNLSMAFVLPTVGFLFGLWLACWWIGRVPMTAPRDQRLRAWGVAAIMSLLAIIVCFGNQGLVRHANRKLTLTVDRAVGERMLAMESNAQAAPVVDSVAGHDELPWEAFQKDSLNQMIQSGQTVMIDFTADWCQTCRALEAFVLNTQPVRDAVQDNQVRTVVADWGTKDPQIGSLLEQLQGSRQIPFLAIFPAGRPQEVMRFSGPYSQATILEALQRAGGAESTDRGTGPAMGVAGITKPSSPTSTSRTPQRVARQPVRLQPLP